MAYEKQTFVDRVVDGNGNVLVKGTTLKAAHLKHMEDGIAAAMEAAEAAGATDEQVQAAVEAYLAENPVAGCPIKYVESMDTSNLVNLRDLETSPYVLYGYFSPYANSDISLTFDNTIVVVSRKSDGSHLLVFTGLNSKLNFLEILVDDTAEKGFTFTRTDFNLLDMHALISKVGSLEELATQDKSSIVAALNEVANKAPSSGGNAEVPVTGWTMTTINDGTDWDRTDRITSGYLSFSSEAVKIVPLNGYMYSIHEYDSEKKWLSQSDSWIEDETILTVTEGHFYRFVLRRGDNGAITVDEGVNLTVYGADGVIDYTELTNKPKINGVELTGDKSLEDLGIGQPTDEQIGSAVSAYLDEHPEATTTVADGSIAEQKLADRAVTNIKISEELLNQHRTANLINPAVNYLPNRYNKNEAASDVYDLIRMVPVKPSTDYVISPILFDELKAYNNTTALSSYYYDESGNYLGSDTLYAARACFTTPANAAFMSIQIIHRENGLDGIMMFEGSDKTAFDWDTYQPYYTYSLNKDIPVSFEQVEQLDEHLAEYTSAFETKANIQKVDELRFVSVVSENMIDPDSHYIPGKKLASNGLTMHDDATSDIIWMVPVKPGTVYCINPDLVASGSVLSFLYKADGTFISYGTVYPQYNSVGTTADTAYVSVSIPHRENGLEGIMLLETFNNHDGWKYMDWDTYLPYHKYALRNDNVIVSERNIPWIAKHIKKPPMFIPAKVNISAHRGDMHDFPENTIPAFESAGKKGVWGIETDARPTSDGVLMCLHDATVDRTTDGEGNLADMTYEQAIALNIDSGANVADYAENPLKIPTFAEYLKICKKYGCVAIVHLQQGDETYISAVYEAVQNMGMIQSVIFVTWVYDEVKAIRMLDKEVCIGVASYGINTNFMSQMEALGGCIGVHALSKTAITEEMVHEAHRRGIYIFASSDDSNETSAKETLEYWYNLGVDNIVHSYLDASIL